MLENGVYCVNKRNLRREDRSKLAENIKSWFKNISDPCEGKRVYIGTIFKEVFYTTQNVEQKSFCNRIVYEMIERDFMPDD